MRASITELISRDEGKTLEFKRDASSPRPILKSLIAFANSAGGRLVIGVDDEKRPQGHLYFLVFDAEWSFLPCRLEWRVHCMARRISALPC